MKAFGKYVTALFFCLFICAGAAFGVNEKPRVIIETDIGINDGDDDASLVRFLLYADVLDIEGMIVTKSGEMASRYGSIKDGFEFMEKFMHAYEQVRPNLIKHSPGFPTADYLRKRVARSWTGEGADLIIAVVDKKDPRPVWYCNWGCDNSMGLALDRIKSTRSTQEYKEFLSKLRFSTLWNQGGMESHFFSITNTYVDIANFVPRKMKGKKKKDRYYRRWADCTIKPWAEANLGGWDQKRYKHYPDIIVKNNGPLCKLYCHSKEGDTPTFTLLLPVGLNRLLDPNPGWGGWSGRASLCDEAKYLKFPINQGNFWWHKKEKDANFDNWNNTISRDNTILRWAIHIQNDLMARCDWCVKPYDEANHPPEVVLNNDRSKDVLQIKAKAGEVVKLDANGSIDPDHDKLKYEWIYYPEPSTYGKRHDLGAVRIEKRNAKKTSFKMPNDAAKGDTIHIILIVTDDGKWPLTRYRRLITTGI